jgi:hypothetical protein
MHIKTTRFLKPIVFPKDEGVVKQKPVSLAFRGRGNVTENSQQFQVALGAENVYEGRETTQYRFCNNIIMTQRGHVARMRRIKDIVKVQIVQLKFSLIVR